MKVINVGLVCLLFVCTLANKLYETSRCREYKKAVTPDNIPDAPALPIFNSNTKVRGTFQEGNPDRILAYEFNADGNSPSVCLSTLDIFNKKRICKTYGFVQKVKFMHYSPDEDVHNEGRVFVIRVYFGQKQGDQKTVIVDVPVFGAEYKNYVNEKLDNYLQDLTNQGASRLTTHVFDWTEEALEAPAKLVKDRSKKTHKMDTYYAHCQYVSKDTLANIIMEFNWTEY